MSRENVRLDWISAMLRTIQAEQRSMRDENDLLRKTVLEVVRLLGDRIGSVEALIEAKIEESEAKVDARIDRLEGTMNLRFDALERRLTAGPVGSSPSLRITPSHHKAGRPQAAAGPIAVGAEAVSGRRRWRRAGRRGRRRSCRSAPHGRPAPTVPTRG